MASHHIFLKKTFADNKVLLLCHDLLADVDTISELKAPWPFLDSVIDSFNLLSSVDIDRILGAVRLTM